MATLLNNSTVVWWIMAVISFLITQGLKWAFVKPFTNKLNNKAKTVVNVVIILIAFAVALLCEFLYSKFWLKAPIDLNRAFSGWGGASAVFGIVEWFLKVFNPNIKIENPYKSGLGEETVLLVKDVINDGKLNANDSEAVKEFVDKINKIT